MLSKVQQQRFQPNFRHGIDCFQAPSSSWDFLGVGRSGAAPSAYPCSSAPRASAPLRPRWRNFRSRCSWKCSQDREPIRLPNSPEKDKSATSSLSSVTSQDLLSVDQNCGPVVVSTMRLINSAVIHAQIHAFPRRILFFALVPGIYGNDFRHLLPDLSALEAAMGCRLYHQWPICDVEDAPWSNALGESF